MDDVFSYGRGLYCSVCTCHLHCHLSYWMQTPGQCVNIMDVCGFASQKSTALSDQWHRSHPTFNLDWRAWMCDSPSVAFPCWSYQNYQSPLRTASFTRADCLIFIQTLIRRYCVTFMNCSTCAEWINRRAPQCTGGGGKGTDCGSCHKLMSINESWVCIVLEKSRCRLWKQLTVLWAEGFIYMPF